MKQADGNAWYDNYAFILCTRNT